MMLRNDYGFPIIDASERERYAPTIEPMDVEPARADRFLAAKAIAAAARERKAQAECECADCVMIRNLDAVKRILAAARERSSNG